MSRYRYHGPVMGLTLVAPDGAGGRTVVAEEILVPGRAYTLPADHPRIVAMVAAKRLTPSEASAVALAADAAPPADPPPTDPTIPPEAPAEAAPRRRRTKEL